MTAGALVTILEHEDRVISHELEEAWVPENFVEWSFHMELGFLHKKESSTLFSPYYFGSLLMKQS